MSSAITAAAVSATGAYLASKKSSDTAKQGLRKGDRRAQAGVDLLEEKSGEAKDARQRGADLAKHGLRSGASGMQVHLDPYAAPAADLYNYMLGNAELGMPDAWAQLQDPTANFMASPDYQFRMDEGLDAVQNSAAAGGAGLYSGNTLRGITDYASNLAAGEFGDWYDRNLALGGRQYQVAGDDYNRMGDMFNYAKAADDQMANIDYQTTTGMANLDAGVEGAYADDLMDVGRGGAAAWSQQAASYSNQPTNDGGYGGISDAIGQGLQNYMWQKKYDDYLKTQKGTTSSGGGKG
jgi:hypothetical protein